MTDVCRQVRVVICEWLAWLLRIKRPGRELGFQDILRKQRVRRLEALIPPSASLISNVKDIDNTIPLSSRQSSDRENVEAQPAAADSCPPYQLAASRPLFYGFVSYAKISDDLSRHHHHQYSFIIMLSDATPHITIISNTTEHNILKNIKSSNQ